MNKQAIRRDLIAKRASLKREFVRDASKLISHVCIELIERHHVRLIHVYNSIDAWNEVESQGLLKLLNDKDDKFSIDVASKNAMAVMPSNQYDCIIIPVLGFDTMRTRIGMGKGWYDTFLATQPHALKIGLSFNVLKCESVPRESHDVQLDYIITEATVY